MLLYWQTHKDKHTPVQLVTVELMKMLLQILLFLPFIDQFK